jgi:pantoate--beta-alanine ligase
MGALHAGHGALFARARAECSHVVATIFVNPRQFNDLSDLAAYPRQEQQDVRLAEAAGVDTLFIPPVEEVFPPEHATWVHVEGAALGYEGAHRPGHFDGVALVCLKLFSMTQPHRAYFGQKDAQQVAVLQQMVRDLNVDLDLRVCPTIRDDEGLALSSRNAHLRPDDRRRALAIPRALSAAVAAHAKGEDAVAAAKGALARSGLAVEYVAIATLEGSPTLVVAARAGLTRLIDNVPLNRPELAGLVRNE